MSDTDDDFDVDAMVASAEAHEDELAMAAQAAQNIHEADYEAAARAAAPPALAEIATQLRAQLGLPGSLNVPQTIERARAFLGVRDTGSSLLDTARRCWTAAQGPAPYDAAAAADSSERDAKRARTSSDYATFVPPAFSADDDDDPMPTQDERRQFAPEQQRAYDAAMGGSNIFLTGGPGVGKSYTLRKIIEGLEDKQRRMNAGRIAAFDLLAREA